MKGFFFKYELFHPKFTVERNERNNFNKFDYYFNLVFGNLHSSY
jgi:hypothetical protein